ncbi:MAG: TonB-dependent receptor, partial [Gammaproteobacteria bacterium]|nr:TonB-dependent receptor [Gammaproteobacteria bacterium]
GMIRYQWPMANGTMAIQGDIDYRSGTLFSLTGADTVNQGGYEVANARLSYTTSDDKWEAAVYVNNLLDEEYRVSQFDLSGNVLIDAGGVLSLVEQYYGRPRWVGGSISYNF